jgi:hypothetical protein
MDDLVEVGVFAGPETLYLKQHRIRSGKQTIELTVPRQPTRAGIDPYRKLIERERDDNVAVVAGKSGAGQNDP